MDFSVHFVRAFKPYAQIGISVSKTVGNSVVRSRVKRIISEACRLNIEKFAIKNYVITAKPPIVDKKSTEIETELLALLKKNHLLKDEQTSLKQPVKPQNTNFKQQKTAKVDKKLLKSEQKGQTSATKTGGEKVNQQKVAITANNSAKKSKSYGAKRGKNV